MKRLQKIAAGIMAASLAVFSFGPLAGCSSSEEYKPELKPAELTSPAIGSSGKLRVGVNTNNSPLAGKSGDKIIGIDVDIAAALADELGLRLETVDVGSEGEAAIEDGDVDVVLGVEASTKVEDTWLSSQYIPTGVVLFELADSDEPTPAATSEPKIAAQVSSKSAWAVSNTFSEDCLVSTNDLANAFVDLGKGKVDYVASDAIIGLYAANRQSVEVKIAALLDSASGYCAMVASDNIELQEAIEDALSTIVSNGVIGVIEEKWLGQTVDLSKVSKIESKKTQTSNVAEKDDEEESADSEEEVVEEVIVDSEA